MKKFKNVTKMLALILVVVIVALSCMLNVSATEEPRDAYGLNWLLVVDSFMSSDGQWEIMHYKDFYNINIPGQFVLEKIPEEVKAQAPDVYAPVTYYGTEKHLTLPTEIDGHKMSVLEFYHLSEYVEELTVPKSYTYLYNVSGDSLRTINFSRKYNKGEIQYIKMFKINNCPSLKKVVLPNVLPEGRIFDSSIGWHNGVEIPSDNIGFFGNDTKLEEVVFPDNLTDIANNTFKNCTNLKNIVIPEGITFIFGLAFEGCQLDILTLPDSIMRCPLNNAKVIVINNKENKIYLNNPDKTFIFTNPTNVIPGDVNGDEEYNINDVTILQQYLAEQVMFDIGNKGDYNKDNKTTSKDALCMQLALVNRYTQPE